MTCWCKSWRSIHTFSFALSCLSTATALIVFAVIYWRDLPCFPSLSFFFASKSYLGTFHHHRWKLCTETVSLARKVGCCSCCFFFFFFFCFGVKKTSYTLFPLTHSVFVSTVWEVDKLDLVIDQVISGVNSGAKWTYGVEKKKKQWAEPTAVSKWKKSTSRYHHRHWHWMNERGGWGGMIRVGKISRKRSRFLDQCLICWWNLLRVCFLSLFNRSF